MIYHFKNDVLNAQSHTPPLSLLKYPRNEEHRHSTVSECTESTPFKPPMAHRAPETPTEKMMMINLPPSSNHHPHSEFHRSQRQHQSYVNGDQSNLLTSLNDDDDNGAASQDDHVHDKTNNRATRSPYSLDWKSGDEAKPMMQQRGLEEESTDDAYLEETHPNGHRLQTNRPPTAGMSHRLSIQDAANESNSSSNVVDYSQLSSSAVSDCTALEHSYPHHHYHHHHRLLLAPESPKIKRPMNVFMVWAQMNRKTVAAKHKDLTNSEISKILGSLWRQMSDEDKEPFRRISDDILRKHREQHPGYRYRPRRRLDRVVKCANSGANHYYQAHHQHHQQQQISYLQSTENHLHHHHQRDGEGGVLQNYHRHHNNHHSYQIRTTAVQKSKKSAASLAQEDGEYGRKFQSSHQYRLADPTFHSPAFPALSTSSSSTTPHSGIMRSITPIMGLDQQKQQQQQEELSLVSRNNAFCNLSGSGDRQSPNSKIHHRHSISSASPYTSCAESTLNLLNRPKSFTDLDLIHNSKPNCTNKSSMLQLFTSNQNHQNQSAGDPNKKPPLLSPPFTLLEEDHQAMQKYHTPLEVIIATNPHHHNCCLKMCCLGKYNSITPPNSTTYDHPYRHHHSYYQNTPNNLHQYFEQSHQHQQHVAQNQRNFNDAFTLGPLQHHHNPSSEQHLGVKYEVDGNSLQSAKDAFHNLYRYSIPIRGE